MCVCLCVNMCICISVCACVCVQILQNFSELPWKLRRTNPALEILPILQVAARSS